MTYKIWNDVNDAKLKGLIDDLEALDHRLILCAKNTSSCTTIQGTTVNGTVLAATYFRNCLCARYDVTPPNLQNKCDGFSQSLYAHNRLNYINVGLVIEIHNKVIDDLLYLD